MAEMSSRFAGSSELDPYVSNANEVIHFKLVRDLGDLEDDSVAFEPEYTHQFFGDSESIFGYIGLKVNFYYSASRLLPVFSMTYDEKVKTSKSGGVEADDVFKIIVNKIEMEPSLNLDHFSSSLCKESSFKPYGKLLNSFHVENEGNEKFTYEVYHSDMSVPGFREYHQKMQTFIFWFIDAASYIDVDDERWEFFVMHEKVKNSDSTCYPFIGYATVYRYYAYPTKVRPRISQMLILPPFQKAGLGAKMLEVMNNFYVADSEVLDITVEDPSENFTRLRDFVDCKNCSKLSIFCESNLLQGFKVEMLKEAQEKFKINKRQARRIFEILRLKCTNTSDKKLYKAYRLDVKNRLNAPFQRQKLDMEKLKKSLSPEELQAAANGSQSDKRIEQLEHLYNELETVYKQVIERLDSC